MYLRCSARRLLVHCLRLRLICVSAFASALVASVFAVSPVVLLIGAVISSCRFRPALTPSASCAAAFWLWGEDWFINKTCLNCPLQLPKVQYSAYVKLTKNLA